MLVKEIKFTKPTWFQKILLLQSKPPSLESLRPTFIGYIRVIKFYHRVYHTKIGHTVLTPQGIGEIIEIIPPELRDTNEHQYQVRLLDNVKAFFDAHKLKYLAVQPTDFFDNTMPILLSFADYPYANPSGMITGTYTFKLTGHGYAMMTEPTKDLLEINKLMIKFKSGRQLLKVMRQHGYQITKKEKTYHVKRRQKNHL